MTFMPFPSGTVLTYAGASMPSGWVLCNGSTYSISDYPELYASLSLTQSITTVNLSTNVTTSSTDTLAVGAMVVASGVPAGAYITSITNSTTFVISSAATAGATVSAQFRQYDRQVDPTTGSAYAQPSAGTFRVPDYRGMFLRGVGTPSGKDACRLGDRQVEKTAPNGLGGTAAGQTQGTSNVSLASGGCSGTTNGQNPSGSVAYRHYQWGGEASILGVAAGTSNAGGGTQTLENFFGHHGHGFGGSASGTTNIGHTHSSSALSVTGDNETRPLNKGINYIIKV